MKERTHDLSHDAINPRRPFPGLPARGKYDH